MGLKQDTITEIENARRAAALLLQYRYNWKSTKLIDAEIVKHAGLHTKQEV